MESVKEEIEKLKKEKKAVILAHYYVPGEVQEIADYIGDSYFLSKKARETDAEVILFAGVSFMGESAKILNPERIVLLPDPQADCPMAHMALPEKIQEMRNRYEDLAVVCYINSSARLKTMSDVCVTSSNAVDIVRKLPNRNIFFIIIKCSIIRYAYITISTSTRSITRTKDRTRYIKVIMTLSIYFNINTFSNTNK